MAAEASGSGTASGPGAAFVVGVDAGGSRTRVVLADPDGVERLRRSGPAGLIDPRVPGESATRLIALVRAAAREARLTLPAAALCAGVAGAGAPALRDELAGALAAAGLAERVAVVQDGEIALEGALAGDAGILLAAGTGSVAFGRAEDGRVERCGGWGRFVGDEGSGWAIGRDGLAAAVRSADGRERATRLLPELLATTGLPDPLEIPPWVARVEKAEVAALAPVVMRVAAAGDAVAAGILDRAAEDLVALVEALLDRLGPWTPPVPLVLHGGILHHESMVGRVMAGLDRLEPPLVRRPAAGDPGTGAVRLALAAAAEAIR